MTYELKLIDTNEPSNIDFNVNENKIHYTTSFISPTKWHKNKLLVLCSDEEIKNTWFYNELFNKLQFWGEDYTCPFKEKCYKVIATNSPTKTPNCYFSEDRVKEFVDYWNKYKELPKFEVEDKIIEGVKLDDRIEPNIINNILQIKWLPKEEGNHGNTLEYWKSNAEENYATTPISVLKYITILEEKLNLQ
jgi:hypothetical protein